MALRIPQCLGLLLGVNKNKRGFATLQSLGPTGARIPCSLPLAAIKGHKRTAYGYRDEDYFFLRIKRELPGKGQLSMLDVLAQAAVINGVLWQGLWASG